MGLKSFFIKCAELQLAAELLYPLHSAAIAAAAAVPAVPLPHSPDAKKDICATREQGPNYCYSVFWSNLSAWSQDVDQKSAAAAKTTVVAGAEQGQGAASTSSPSSSAAGADSASPPSSNAESVCPSAFTHPFAQL